MSQRVICPNCNTEIDLDKVQAEVYDKMWKEKEEKLKEEQNKQKLAFDKELEIKTEEMRKKAKEFAEEKAREERKKVEVEFKDMEARLKKAEESEDEAKKRELNFLKKQRELEDKEKNFELELEKKLYNERKKIEEDMEKRLKELNDKETEEKIKNIQEDFRKKELEYQKQQEQLKKSLDDAQRKATQGSQQIQWDIQEDDLKNALMMAFPIDDISDVPTGIKWADLIQTVKNNLWQAAWTIIWESKNTKTWSDSWLMKLKEDKIKVSWNLAIIVSSVLPNEMKYFWTIDDIMICVPEFAIQVATMLRDKILSISKVEKSLEWKDIKMELLYKYLSSEEFASKINMMVDVFANLKWEIDMERRSMERNWKRREKDIERATFAITWMYWELESLMGQSLPGWSKLELYSWDIEDDFDDEDINL